MAKKTNKTTKKRRSQLPVALVYFATMLMFLAVFGLIASFVVNRLNELNSPREVEPVAPDPTYNMLYARVNSKNVLSDMSIVRIAPENNSVTVIPITSFIKADNGDTFRMIYSQGGIKDTISNLEETLDIKITNYVTISNDAFEHIADLLGGVIYTPAEDLFYLSKNDADDISFRKGQTVTLMGRQIRLMFQYPVFSNGKAGNLEFMGTAMDSLIKSTFKQTSITTTNLDNMYNIITENADTDLDKNKYREQKKYIKKMLDTNAINCKMLLPSGVWTDNELNLSDDFKEQLKNLIEQTEPKGSSSQNN